MDNAQKAIMIGVGLFITIIIISAVLLVTNIGRNLIGGATEQLSNISTMLQGQLTSSYDGKIVTGTDVINAANQYANNTEIAVRIVVDDGTQFETGAYTVNVAARTGGYQTVIAGGVECSGTGSNGTYNVANKATLTQIQNAVSTMHSYYSYTLRDSESGTVMGVLFVRKAATNAFDGGVIPSAT